MPISPLLVEISKEELDQEDPYLHDGCRGKSGDWSY